MERHLLWYQFCRVEILALIFTVQPQVSYLTTLWLSTSVYASMRMLTYLYEESSELTYIKYLLCASNCCQSFRYFDSLVIIKGRYHFIDKEMRHSEVKYLPKFPHLVSSIPHLNLVWIQDTCVYSLHSPTSLQSTNSAYLKGLL